MAMNKSSRERVHFTADLIRHGEGLCKVIERLGIETGDTGTSLSDLDNGVDHIGWQISHLANEIEATNPSMSGITNLTDT